MLSALERSETSLIVEQAGSAVEWNGFLTRHSDASFYHLFEWQHVNRGALIHRSIYLIARYATEVRGVLPLTFVTSTLFGRILCSLPFVNYGGPCALDVRASSALIAVATRYADEARASYLELRCASKLQTEMPVSLRKVGMVLELAPDPSSIWNRFSAKHRKNIRRAYKNGLSVRTGGIELLPGFYRVLTEAWRDLGTPIYAKRYFDTVLRTFPTQTRIFICELGGVPVAVALTGYFNGVVEGLWAGGRAAAKPLNANYVLYWEMIRDACERGCRLFHLGRSTSDSGAEEFKRKWNAQPKQLYWYFHVPEGSAIPQLNVDNPKYRAAIHTWQHLPLWTTRLIGPPIARGIP